MCDCINWARLGNLPLTRHHPNCPSYNVEKESVEVVKNFVRAFELTSTPEIPPVLWNAYLKANHFIGEFHSPLTEVKQ